MEKQKMRNLKIDEIVGQFMIAKTALGDFERMNTAPRACPRHTLQAVTQCVAMGMGEPGARLNRHNSKLNAMVVLVRAAYKKAFKVRVSKCTLRSRLQLDKCQEGNAYRYGCRRSRTWAAAHHHLDVGCCAHYS